MATATDYANVARNASPADAGVILESLIDVYGLTKLTEAIARICYAKSMHLAHTWQDAKTAKAWQIDGTKYDFLVSRLKDPQYQSREIQIAE